MSESIREILDGWTEEERINLSAILGVTKPAASSPKMLAEEISGLYHSRAREVVKVPGRALSSFVRETIQGKERSNNHKAPPSPPTFHELVEGLSKKLNVHAKDVDVETLETYITQAVIVHALKKMSPEDRVKFFEEKVDMGVVIEEGNITDNGFKGPMRTLAAIGAANSVGFSLFAASTTALGFVTHAVGIALPFSVYTGMTSTIAFVIGPVGWLAAGSWLVWATTGPIWKKLLPVVIYIIALKSAKNTNAASGVLDRPAVKGET